MIVTSTITAVAGCAAGLLYLLHIAKKGFEFFVKLGQAVEQVDQKTQQLEPNGGKSLHDQITKLVVRQSEQQALIEEQSRTLLEQNAVIADLQARPRVGIRLRR